MFLRTPQTNQLWSLLLGVIFWNILLRWQKFDLLTFKYCNSFDNNLIHVIQIWDTLLLEVLNLKARSSTKTPSLNLIILIKSSCFNKCFLSGPCLLTGMSTLSYLGDWNIILICSELQLFDFCRDYALFWPSQYLITIALHLTLLIWQCGSGVKISKILDITLSSKLFKPNILLVMNFNMTSKYVLKLWNGNAVWYWGSGVLD